MTAGKPQPIDPRYVSLLWAGPERAAELAQLHAQLFDPPWDATSISASLEHPGSTSFVALTGQPRQLAGFIMGQLVADEAEIISVGVAPEFQRRGLGRYLVEGLARAARKAEAKRLFLEVASDNSAAKALYDGLGFQVIGGRRGYYARKSGPAADAINLALAL